MDFRVYMDFCPSESFGMAEKCPDSPFVAAGCVLRASPEVEEEIRKFLEPKSKFSRLHGMELVRGKIQKGELELHALCLTGTEMGLSVDGAMNCLTEDARKLVRGLNPEAIRNAGKAAAGKVAQEIGMVASEAEVISTMSFVALSHHCAVYFLERCRILGANTRGNVKVVIDKVPGEDQALLKAIEARRHAPRKAHLEFYDSVIEINPIESKADPCGLLVADMLAYVTAGIIGGFASFGEIPARIKKSPQLPKCKPGEKKRIREFSNFMLKGGYLMHVTPMLLMAMVEDGTQVMRKVMRLQLQYGLGYSDRPEIHNLIKS